MILTEAALFDLDGTLLDTKEFIYQAFEYTFKLHGLPVRSRDELTAIIGRALDECYDYLFPSADTRRLCETHLTFQVENIHLSVPFSKSQETLEKLKAAGIKIAVITTR